MKTPDLDPLAMPSTSAKHAKIYNPSDPDSRAALTSVAQPKKKHTRLGRGLISSASFRAIWDCKPRDPRYHTKNQWNLANRQLRTSLTIASETFDIITHGNFSKPGWQGCPPPRVAMDLLLSRYHSGEIKHDLSSFFPVPYPMPPLLAPLSSFVCGFLANLFPQSFSRGPYRHHRLQATYFLLPLHPNSLGRGQEDRVLQQY